MTSATTSMAPLGKNPRVYKHGGWGTGTLVAVLVIIIVHIILKLIVRAVIQVLQKLDWDRRRHERVEPTSQEIHRPRVT